MPTVFSAKLDGRTGLLPRGSLVRSHTASRRTAGPRRLPGSRRRVVEGELPLRERMLSRDGPCGGDQVGVLAEGLDASPGSPPGRDRTQNVGIEWAVRRYGDLPQAPLVLQVQVQGLLGASDPKPAITEQGRMAHGGGLGDLVDVLHVALVADPSRFVLR